MRIDWVQERSAGHAIGCATLKARGIHRTCIATDYVVSATTRVVRIVNPELSLIQNIEGLSAELEIAGFPYLEVLQDRNIGVKPARIIQEVPACITECEPTQGDKLRWIGEERAE